MKKFLSVQLFILVLLLIPVQVYAQDVPGDADGDGDVDGVDFSYWLSNFNTQTDNGPSDGDFNDDGDVDGVDFSIWLNNFGTTSTPTVTQSPPTSTPGPSPTAPPPTGGGGIWISPNRLASLPTTGSAWNNVRSAADGSAGTPDLSNQDDPTNVIIMAKALVYARNGGASYYNDVRSALSHIANSGSYNGRALALGRELGAYVIAADLIDLKNNDPALDSSFRLKIRELLRTSTSSGPSNLVECDEKRGNNWGTMCGFSRAAVAAYLDDSSELSRAAQVFRGWLGDRSAYSGYDWGDLCWQSDPNNPVGINPPGATINGNNVDGVLPDDQRRDGCSWPPSCANYVWGGLAGALGEAIILHQAGYDVWNWEDQALRRTHVWLHSADVRSTNWCAASGDNSWEPHIVNYYYNTNFPAPVPASPGKNAGWTDWTHQ